jgi:hypothetical protein
VVTRAICRFHKGILHLDMLVMTSKNIENKKNSGFKWTATPAGSLSEGTAN